MPEKKGKTITISHDIHEAVAAIAKRDRRTISATVDIILENVLIQHERINTAKMAAVKDFPSKREECEPCEDNMKEPAH